MRFETNHINDLIAGSLSPTGYKHIIGVISYYVKKNNWPINIVVTNSVTHNWSSPDFEELAHEFFEWVLSKNKLQYVGKIPMEYRSFYFLQLLISFVSEKIAQIQTQTGISFKVIRNNTLDILNADFCKIENTNSIHWFNSQVSGIAPISFDLVQSKIQYLPKVRLISKSTRVKPLIKNVLSQVFDVCEQPIEEGILIKIVYSLFDQSYFHAEEQFEKTSTDNNIYDHAIQNHNEVINSITKTLSKTECTLILSYLFADHQPSLEELSAKFNLPKSTIHFKISSFKKKIQANYQPENQEDGEIFMKNIYDALDKIASK